jgi:FKBP-type peptidyl-prolyl cis-trans isomerase (trigger factor)
MKISQHNTDDLNATITLCIEKADYEPRVKKSLNEYRRKADIKGFRQGMAPMSLVEKMHGKSALLDEVKDIISENLSKYIEENNVQLLGEPLPNEDERQKINWDAPGDMEFKFDIGIVPAIDITFTAEDKIPYYKIPVTAADLNKYRENVQRQYGKLVDAETKRFEPAELNQDLYDRVFGEGVVKSEEEFNQKAKARIASEYEQECEYRFTIDAREEALKKADIKLPERFLKRWMLHTSEEKPTAEQLDKDFSSFADDVRWQILRRHFKKIQELKVTEEDLREHALKIARYQFAVYGLHNASDAQLEHFANSILANEQELKRICEKVEEEKVIAYVRSAVTLDEKEITADQLQKLYEKK